MKRTMKQVISDLKPEKATKMPSAAARTISMFTGKTDQEGGEFARDGSRPEEVRRHARDPYVGYNWVGGRGYWMYVKTTQNGDKVAGDISQNRDGSWTPRISLHGGNWRSLPDCADMHAATQAVYLELAKR